MGVPVVIGGDNQPSPVRIGLTDLQNIGGASGPPGPAGSGSTEYMCIVRNCGNKFSMSMGKTELRLSKRMFEFVFNSTFISEKVHLF